MLGSKSVSPGADMTLAGLGVDNTDGARTNAFNLVITASLSLANPIGIATGFTAQSGVIETGGTLGVT